MSISDFSMGGWTSAAIDRISLKIVFYYVIWILFFGFCSRALDSSLAPRRKEYASRCIAGHEIPKVLRGLRPGAKFVPAQVLPQKGW